MKKVFKKKNELLNNKELVFAATNNVEALYTNTNSSLKGLANEDVERNRELYGNNIIATKKKKSVFKRMIESYVNPFTAILFFLAIVSLFTDVIFASKEDKSFVTIIIILTMVIVSGTLKFVQDTRSSNSAEKLAKMVHTTTRIRRDDIEDELSLDEVVKGDIIVLSAGDMIPADLRIISAKDLFISQSSLTGESEPIEKFNIVEESNKSVTDYKNLAFMGSNVISGSGMGIVVNTGNNTLFGSIIKNLDDKKAKTTFEKGISKVSWLLIKFMLVMVPFVFLVNGITKGNWIDALLFAVSIAVGLTPEMLPMIVTTNLAKGSVVMSKKKVIVKNLNSIQNLGSIDILCTDKTGTLTQDDVILERHMDVHGKIDNRVLRHAWLNSYYQTGLKNLIDKAVINRFNEIFGDELQGIYHKIDEIPFDFNRRRMSVVITDNNGKKQMITKGAIEEMIKCSKYVEYDGRVEILTEQLKSFVINQANKLNDEGMRVIAVAQKDVSNKDDNYSINDESEMVLIGYLAFLDPPKDSTKDAIKSLHEYGVDVKILTGDNEKVTKYICKKVGISNPTILLGAEIDNYDDNQLQKKVEKTTIFAKLSPSQKARVIEALKANGHSVGYMGDGINDANAMKAADVAISVDSAVDIAKETADVILLEKDLNVLKDGIIEGRKTYANTIKYIKMTASSNFGNMFSVLVASAFLPFLPMISIQLILLNLIYDISCVATPWDNVDQEFIKVPRAWEAKSLLKFMIWFGPTSSIFDIITYLVMFFVVCPLMVGTTWNNITDDATRLLFISIFQTGWFIESMWTQTLVIHMIRTPKIPFIKSRASLPVFVLTFSGILLLTIIPFTPLGTYLSLTSITPLFFLWLFSIVAAYIILVTVVKKIYVRKYKELL